MLRDCWCKSSFKARAWLAMLMLLLPPPLLVTNAESLSQQPNIAMYYGDNPPLDELHAFDQVVFEPSSGLDPKQYNTSHSQAIAYVSISEVTPHTRYSKDIKKSWIIGHNNIWKASVLDTANPQWQNYLLNKVITPLMEEGYKGVLFDTMDSYQLVPEARRAAQIKGMETIVREVKAKFPQAKIIFNRGFELLPAVHQDVYAVAAESLFGTWDEKNKRYDKVDQQEYNWLLNQLNLVHDKYNLPVVVMDYAPPGQRALAESYVKKIEALGFIPWVSSGHLNQLGLGKIAVLPRKVLVLYDGAEAKSVMDIRAQLYAAMPLNYMGYVPVLRDMRQPLPTQILTGRYAGILVWPKNNYSGVRTKIRPWLLKQIRQGMRVTFMDNFGFQLNSRNLGPFGINAYRYKPEVSKLKISMKSNMMGYEAKPRAELAGFAPINLTSGTPLFEVEDALGKKSDMAAITPWGGYVLAPYVIQALPNETSRWFINPFEFFKATWRLPLMPVPDVTTENGRRLMMVHVDGDGFISRAEWDIDDVRFAGDVMEEKIFKKYKVPTTVSVIVGEIAPFGVLPKYSKRFMDTARSTFKLPWVEIGSHTYSHPYFWREIEAQPELSVTEKNRYNLPVPGYKFDVNQEVLGSVDWIDRELAPKGKKVSVFLWSGDTDPSPNAVRLAYADGLVNLNGGDTKVTKANNSITSMAPLGVYKGKYYQVFAPNQNENYYTNDWLGPFYGFERVIETFQLTENPVRYKPIDVYYHYYSATKQASLSALNKVYDWALNQSVFNIYISEYFEKVMGFNHVVIAKTQEGWLIRNYGALRELRIPISAGYPDLSKSQNIAGYNKHGNSYYLHLGPDTQTYLQLQPKPPINAYLASANARLTKFERTKDGLLFDFKGHMPLIFELANAKGCSLKDGNGILQGKQTTDGMTEFKLAGTQSHGLTLRC